MFIKSSIYVRFLFCRFLSDTPDPKIPTFCKNRTIEWGELSWPHYVIPFKGYSVDTDCMTEASEESKRNRPYFQHSISEQLAIEKTICNKKK